MRERFNFEKLENIIKLKNPYFTHKTEVKAVISRKELQKLLDSTNRNKITIPLYLRDKGTHDVSESYFILDKAGK